jgi:hypothetical protein
LYHWMKGCYRLWRDRGLGIDRRCPVLILSTSYWAYGEPGIMVTGADQPDYRRRFRDRFAAPLLGRDRRILQADPKPVGRRIPRASVAGGACDDLGAYKFSNQVLAEYRFRPSGINPFLEAGPSIRRPDSAFQAWRDSRSGRGIPVARGPHRAGAAVHALGRLPGAERGRRCSDCAVWRRYSAHQVLAIQRRYRKLSSRPVDVSSPTRRLTTKTALSEITPREVGFRPPYSGLHCDTLGATQPAGDWIPSVRAAMNESSLHARSIGVLSLD